MFDDMMRIKPVYDKDATLPCFDQLYYLMQSVVSLKISASDTLLRKVNNYTIVKFYTEPDIERSLFSDKRQCQCQAMLALV